MYIDEFKHQLPDIDEAETQEWLESLDQVLDQAGENRARFLMFKLLKRARQLQIGLPGLIQTRYINTITPEQEPCVPGRRADGAAHPPPHPLERRGDGAAREPPLPGHRRAPLDLRLGGHPVRGRASTTSSAARTTPAAATRSSSRATRRPASTRARSSRGACRESQLDHFRREIGGKGLTSYPHPRLMPDFWEFPTVSMGLGPITAIYQARFNRYLHARGIPDTSGQRVWAFLGDGEMDEPEAIGGSRWRPARGSTT